MAASLCILPATAEETAKAEVVGGQSYPSLAEAVAAAESGDTVKLLQNITMDTNDIVTIPAGKTLTLDMDGKSIETSSNFAGRPLVNEGTLTVTGNGTIDSSMSEEGGYGAINNKGTLTVENGTYRGAIYASGSAIRNTGEGAMLTIEDGTFEKATCAVFNEGTALINGGTFSGETCSSCNNAIWSYTIRNYVASAKMTINGGTFIGTQGAVSASVGTLGINGGHFKTVDCAQNHGAIFYALYAAGEVGEVECVINSGTFETVGKYAAVLVGNDNPGGDGGIGAQATAYVKGGTFRAPNGVPALKGAAETGDPIITGGTFSSDVSAYVADGYSCIEKEGNYVINGPVAAIGNVKYATLAEAVEAAQEGDTVEVLTDTTLNGALRLTKSIALRGAAADGRKPILGGASGLFSAATDAVNATLDGLELQITAGTDKWALYHSAGHLTVRNCAFTMGPGVTSTGNLIMGEGGAKDSYQLTFINNTIKANSRAAITGEGNNSVITGNDFDLISPKYGNTESRTSTISLTADDKSGPITITGNTFRNANRALAVDNAGTLPADKLIYQENRFIDVRYGFEMGSSDNASCGQYDLSKNYFVENGVVSALRVEDANANEASHFDDTSLYLGTQVTTAPYYTRDALGDPTALSNYVPSGSSDSGSSNPPKPTVDTETKTEGDVKTETVTETVKNKDGSTTTNVTETATNAATGEKTETKATETVAKDGSVTKEEVKTTTAADGTKTEEKNVAISDKATGTETTAQVVTDGTGKTVATARTEARPEAAVKDGAATAAVDQKAAEKLVEQAKAAAETAKDADRVEAAVVLTAQVPKEEAVTAVSVEVPKAAVESLAKETTAAVVVSTPIADVTLPNSALESLAGQKGETVAVKAEKTGDGGVKVAVTVGNRAMETVSGGLKASLPVEEAAPGTVAVLVHADGTEEIIRKSVVTDGTAVVPLDGSATIKLVDNGKDFPDTEDHWAGEAVEFVTARGLFQGVGDDSFAPGAEMTRGMLVTVLNRLENEPAAAGTPAFPDVTDGAYYAGAVAWAAETGIVTGTGAGFDPEAPITRQTLATILYRYLGTQGADLSLRGDLSAYADGDAVDGWAQEAVAYAVGAGLMTGKDGGVLDPAGTATRAEVAIVLQRMVEGMA